MFVTAVVQDTKYTYDTNAIEISKTTRRTEHANAGMKHERFNWRGLSVRRKHHVLYSAEYSKSPATQSIIWKTETLTEIENALYRRAMR